MPWRGLALISVLVVGFLGARGAHASSIVSADTQLVLLNGVAGDAENESAYAAELKDWLVLAKTAGVRKTVVLCDDPSALSGSDLPGLKVSKASRENFLQVPSMLDAGSGSTTFIIWGHGGEQSGGAVFHVRGPRITPEDMASVAAKLTPTNANVWILMFRGSGQFAQALAGPTRQILSSDGSSPSPGDPISFALLTKAVEHEPSISLESVGQSVVRAAARWYEQRHLAAAEQPTVWLNGARSPTPGPDLAQSSSERETEGAAQPVSSVDSERPRQSAVSESRLDPGSSAQKVNPNRYPRSPAVVLRSSKLYMLGNSPAVVTENDQWIQVLKPEGKQYGDFDVSFFPPHEELEFLVCEVINPEGKRLSLDPDAVGVSREMTQSDYDAGQRKFFSLPGVGPGSVMHVRYRSTWKDYPLPRISLAIPVGGELPVVEARVEVRVPKDWPLHFAFDGLEARPPAVTHTEYSTSQTWQWKDLAPTDADPLAGPRHRPAVWVSTFRDWAEFSSWYGHIIRQADEISPEISAKARELTRDAKTEQEKVRRLYEYVTGLRYVALPLGINSVRPHAAARVLQNQFGDCKDKANLLNTLLHALNIPADLVLVPRFKQAYENLPGLAFNHAISRVMLDGQAVWLDSTDEVCRFGFLPPGDSGRNVLVIDSKSTGLARLPEPEFGEQRVQIRGTLDPTEQGRSFTTSLVVDASGCGDYQMRTDAHESGAEAASIALLSHRYRPVFGIFALEHQQATPVSDKSQNFRWRGTGAMAGLVAIAGRDCTIHSPFWIPREWDLALNRRHAPLFLNDGYPLTLDEEIQITVPPGTEHSELPAAARGTEGPLAWQIDWARRPDGRLVATLRAELRHGDLSISETAQFQTQVRALLAALASDSRLTLSGRLSVR